MTKQVELFCEDSAHESCARALVGRIAGELQLEVSIRTATASAGIGRLKRELKAFQSWVSHRSGTPDLLVILVDANAIGPAARRAEIEGVLDSAVFPSYVIGTPNPCVERWLLSDPVSFAETFGVQPALGTPGARHFWKTRLRETLEAAGQIVVQGGAELAEEIVAHMDFYRAGRSDPTIQAFTNDLRVALRSPG
ncbi:MAG TPA: hypothetical protein VG147_14385 [Solirubrobacteraceae bacterium]|jgi:hypothetical protein|nr:hypothetical protein [Solirubrobacteraceae bacterium]